MSSTPRGLFTELNYPLYFRFLRVSLGLNFFLKGLTHTLKPKPNLAQHLVLNPAQTMVRKPHLGNSLQSRAITNFSQQLQARLFKLKIILGKNFINSSGQEYLPAESNKEDDSQHPEI